MEPNIDLQLLKSVSFDVVGTVPITFMAQGVCLTTEKLHKGALFIPLFEKDRENQQELVKAVEKGASAAIWKKGVPLPKEIKGTFPVFLVQDCLEALKELAKKYLDEVDPAVVAVTGSEGSSLAKDLSAHILSNHFHVASSQQNKMGVVELCVLILNMDRNTSVLISEYSIDEVAEMSKLIEPNFAMITDITPSVFDESKTEDEVFRATTRIESGMRASASLLIDGDNKLLINHEWISDAITCGFSEDCLFQVNNIQKEVENISFELTGVHMPFLLRGDQAQYVKYATFAIAISVQLGLLPDQIRDQLQEFVLEKNSYS